jgi:short-subunit dehydrogenase
MLRAVIIDDGGNVLQRPGLFEMNSRRVLLTGASAGIGRAIADRLTERGHQVWGTSRNRQRLPAHANFHPLEMDLSNIDSIRSSIAGALDESGGFDVLINNAGSGIFAPLEKLSHEHLNRQFQLLVFAPMELIKLLLPGMRASHHGLIVNVTSLAAVFPIPYMGAYSACKAALSTLSWTLEMELCAEPVRVVELRPGDIRTDFHKTMECHESLGEAEPGENIARAYHAYTGNMENAPSPERVAQLVSRLLDDDQGVPSQCNVGGTFQARVAPLLRNVSPRRWTRLALKKYYRLRCRRS